MGVSSERKIGRRKDYQSALDVVRLFLKAAELNYTDPLRFGNILNLPGSGDVMITGDLHGNMGNFKRIVEIANLERNPRRHVLFQEVIHSANVAQEGVAVSFEVLNALARLKTQYPARVHMIIANHDIAQACEHFIVKGGSILNMTFEAGLREIYGDLKPEVKAGYAQLVFSMPAAARTKTGIFISHSLPDPKALETFDYKALTTPMDPAKLLASPIASMVWGRDLSQQVAERFAQIVQARLFVIGHTPCDTGYRIANSLTLIIDTKDENGRLLLLPLNRKFESARAMLPCLVPVMGYPGAGL
jgi:hypothetical protein